MPRRCAHSLMLLEPPAMLQMWRRPLKAAGRWAWQRHQGSRRACFVLVRVLTSRTSPAVRTLCGPPAPSTQELVGTLYSLTLNMTCPRTAGNMSFAAEVHAGRELNNNTLVLSLERLSAESMQPLPGPVNQTGSSITGKQACRMPAWHF